MRFSTGGLWPANTGIAQVSTGYVHTCALRTDGSVYCWGSNSYGQLGAGSGAVGQVPLQVTEPGPA
jgi:alpha-tubulin suppressor-like RCC1 family protein